MLPSDAAQTQEELLLGGAPVPVDDYTVAMHRTGAHETASSALDPALTLFMEQAADEDDKEANSWLGLSLHGQPDASL